MSLFRAINRSDMDKVKTYWIGDSKSIKELLSDPCVGLSGSTPYDRCCYGGDMLLVQAGVLADGTPTYVRVPGDGYIILQHDTCNFITCCSADSIEQWCLDHCIDKRSVLGSCGFNKYKTDVEVTEYKVFHYEYHKVVQLLSDFVNTFEPRGLYILTRAHDHHGVLYIGRTRPHTLSKKSDCLIELTIGDYILNKDEEVHVYSEEVFTRNYHLLERCKL
jgi:hypothetical protein